MYDWGRHKYRKVGEKILKMRMPFVWITDELQNYSCEAELSGLKNTLCQHYALT